MKNICTISGIYWDCQHIASAVPAQYNHPVFSLSQKRLLSIVSAPSFNLLDNPVIDNYLIFLALFNSSDLIIFDTPAQLHDGTVRLIANNLGKLIDIIGRINIIKHPALQLPKIRIDRDTRSLDNISAWLGLWEKGINDFLDGNREQALHEKLVRRENALHKYILNSSMSVEKYATRLAEWCEIAADFPRNILILENGSKIPCNEYYKEIIISCASKKPFLFPAQDIEVAYEYISENIELGTIYAHTVLKLLGECIDNRNAYYALYKIRTVTKQDIGFVIVRDGELIEPERKQQEVAALQRVLDNAPKTEPRKEDFASKLEYMKAKLAYDVSKE